MKLSYKIYILFAAVSLAIVFSVFGITYYLTRTILINSQYSAYARLTEISAKRIDYFLSEKMSSAKVLATRPIVYDSLTGVSPDHFSKIRENLQESEAADQYIAGIYIIDRNKNVVVSTDKNPTVSKVPDLPVQEKILSKIFSGEIAYSDIFISEITGEPAMIFAAPVFDGRKNILGAAEVYITWSEVINILKDIKVTFVHLINSKGLEIGSNIPEQYGDILKEDYSQEPLFQKFFADAQEGAAAKVSIEKDLHTNSEVVSASIHLFGSHDYKGNGWILVLEESVDNVISPINQAIANVILYTLLVILLFLAVLLWLLKKYLLNPVTEISNISKRISAGEKNLRIPSMSKDELGVLAREFNVMIDRFQGMNAELESKVLEKTSQLEKELKTKEAQTDILEQNKKATLNLLEDIAAEKNRAESLALDLTKFELAVESASEHIVITDKDGVILYANRASEELTGYSHDELIGSKSSLWGKQMPKEFYAQLWKTIKIDKKVFTGLIKNRKKNGVIYDADTQISPITDSSGEVRFFVGIERDVTDQRKLDEARNNFIAVASHQLRTPLTAIKWISELLLSGDVGFIADKQKELMNDLHVSTERMIDLVNALLNIARIESTELTVKSEKVNLKKISENILDELRLLTDNKKQSARLSVGEGIDEIQTDSGLLREILKNILINSIKYTNENGIIGISIEKSGDETVISVRDNGIGIPKDQQSKIFTRFFRADNAMRVLTDGTGLGMYISKNLTDLLGGRIWFESEEGIGTTFHIALPVSGPHERKGSKPLVSVKNP